MFFLQKVTGFISGIDVSNFVACCIATIGLRLPQFIPPQAGLGSSPVCRQAGSVILCNNAWQPCTEFVSVFIPEFNEVSYFTLHRKSQT
jgi:hypothetical protein